MLLRVAVFLLLCAVSSSCFANETCETIGVRAAGEVDYLFEVAKVTSPDRLHFLFCPRLGMPASRFFSQRRYR